MTPHYGATERCIPLRTRRGSVLAVDDCTET